MADTLDQALKWVILMEGGYVNDPDDYGGETKYGISKLHHPDVDIKNLTEEGAKEIYRQYYWNPLHCDDLKPVAALLLFDSAVNHGQGKKLFQKGVGVTPDGVIGPMTIAAANTKSNDQLIKDCLTERDLYYQSLVLRDRTQEKFSRIWFRRLHMLTCFIYENGIH